MIVPRLRATLFPYTTLFRSSNAAEAREVKAVADAHPDLVVMEAFHYRYHPFAERLQAIVASGELGTIERVETAMCFPLLKRDRKSTRLNSSHVKISYAVFCL